MGFMTYIESNKTYIEDVLKDYIPKAKGPESLIQEAMLYSLMAGGKRLRPLIMLEVFKLFNNKTDKVEGFLAAIEMIHTYSLIHDDLPAMDDDELRRGMPTCHVQFGEDIAILAGDGLLNLAYETMCHSILEYGLGNDGLQAMTCLADKAGVRGMVGGQVADVTSENQVVDMETVLFIHSHKTAALIEAAFMVGAYVAGATFEQIQLLQQIGYNVGLAFQIQDDLLDVFSTEEKLGKPINSDEKNRKMTYVELKGYEASKKDVKDLLMKADQLTDEIGGRDPGFIKSLIRYIGERDY